MTLESVSNVAFYDAHVSDYEMDYFRSDEIYVNNKYIKGDLLVLGCGAGRVLPYMACKKMIAIDNSPEMVAKAKQRFPNFDIQEQNAANLPREWGNKFDSVFFPFHGIDYVHPDPYEAIKEAHRVLKPGGMFVFSSHNRFAFRQWRYWFGCSFVNYKGLVTYRTSPFDTWLLRGVFRKVKVHGRMSISDGNSWKDWFYKIFPIFDKSTYFICLK